MNIIAGLEEPTGGSVRLDGKDITALPPADRNVSMVFQSYALYPNMTVARNIEIPLRMRKVDKATREERVRSVAKLLQIEHLLERRPRQLSGGQRQRVAIGRALAREPRLYLLDEPLSNLDAQLRLDMRTEIKKLHQRLGATVVYVTHDQIEAMTLATRIAVMKGGVVQQLGTPYEV
jgi:multiple sugar transport system ATP-binding protein